MNKLPSTKEFIAYEMEQMYKSLTEPDEILKVKQEKERKERIEAKKSDSGII